MFRAPSSHWGKLALISILTIAAVGLVVGSSVVAAPPITVSYFGSPVTTGVPGKAFEVKFQVKNTSGDDYSAVKVIFHIPDGLKHSKVSPGAAEIVDDTVVWNNVPMTAGQSLYPALTFTLDSGTSLKTKKNIWVEVTGDGMEATSTNFSITAVSATAKTATAALSSTDVKSIFQTVYGRAATSSELTYWLGRRSDKPTRSALLGAMQFHKAQNIPH